MRFVFLLLVIFGTVTAKLDAVEERQDLPLVVLASGHFAVPVRVNGEGPFLFLLDTGAESTAIFRRLTIELLLAQSDVGRVTVMGLNGPSDRAVYEVGSLGIGDREVRLARTFVLENSVMEDRALYGIIGADILLRFVVEIDRAAEVVRFHHHETDLDVPGSGWQSVAIAPLRGRLIQTQVEVDGEPLIALLDTGSPISALTPYAAGLIDPANRRITSSQQVLRGAHGGYSAALRLPRARLRVGDMLWPAGDMLVADLPVLRSLGWRDRAAIIIGSNFLGQRRFAIDYADKRLLFYRNSGSAATTTSNNAEE